MFYLRSNHAKRALKCHHMELLNADVLHCNQTESTQSVDQEMVDY